jgi:hypothetical protein
MPAAFNLMKTAAIEEGIRYQRPFPVRVSRDFRTVAEFN